MDTFNHQFYAVYRGSWYRVASLNEHLRAGVDPCGKEYLLFDDVWRKTMAPKAEVKIPADPLPPDPVRRELRVRLSRLMPA